MSRSRTIYPKNPAKETSPKFLSMSTDIYVGSPRSMPQPSPLQDDRSSFQWRLREEGLRPIRQEPDTGPINAGDENKRSSPRVITRSISVPDLRKTQYTGQPLTFFQRGNSLADMSASTASTANSAPSPMSMGKKSDK